MAKAFVKHLGNSLYQDGSIPHQDNLRQSFKEAIINLPKGTLRTKLTTNFNKYFSTLEKKIQKLSGLDADSKCKRDSDSLEELTTSGGRKDVEDHLPNKLVYNIVNKSSNCLPDEEVMKDYSDDQKKQIYNVYLGQMLSRQRVNQSIIEEVTSRLLPLLPQPSNDKSQFDWLPVMSHMIQLCTRTSPASVISVLQMFFDALITDFDQCIRKLKVVRAGKLAGIIKNNLTIFKMKTDSSRMNVMEEKQYCLLVSSLLSCYLDLSCLHSRKMKKKKMFGRQVCGFVSYMLQWWPASLLEAVLQTEMIGEEMVNVVLPLVRQCLMLKPTGSDHRYYLLYVLLVRKVTDKLGQLDALLEYTLLANNIPAPPGFFDWLQDHCSAAMDNLPVEDRKFRKVKVTRFLLREADDDLLDILKESLQAPETCSEDADTTTSIDQGASNTVDLFFIDKGNNTKPTQQAISRVDESISGAVLTPSKSGRGRLTELHQDENLIDVSSRQGSETQAPPDKRNTHRSKATLAENEFISETDSDVSQGKRARARTDMVQSVVRKVTPKKDHDNPLQVAPVLMNVGDVDSSSLSTSIQSLDGSSTSGAAIWTDDTITIDKSDVNEKSDDESDVITVLSDEDSGSDSVTNETTVLVQGDHPEHLNLAHNDTTLKVSDDKVTAVEESDEDEMVEGQENALSKSVDCRNYTESETEQDRKNESDSEVFVISPQKKASKDVNIESVQLKFIGKAMKSKTPKKIEPVINSMKKDTVGSETIFIEENSEKGEDDINEKTTRTKSTEEIVHIVEGIKQNLETPTSRRTNWTSNDDSKMFTDDSVDSMEDSEQNGKYKYMGSPSPKKKKLSPRKRGSSSNDDVSSPRKTPQRKSSKTDKKPDDVVLETPGENEDNDTTETKTVTLTPQKMIQETKYVGKAKNELVKEISKTSYVDENVSAMDRQSTEEKQMATKIPLEAMMSPKRGLRTSEYKEKNRSNSEDDNSKEESPHKPSSGKKKKKMSHDSAGEVEEIAGVAKSYEKKSIEPACVEDGTEEEIILIKDGEEEIILIKDGNEIEKTTLEEKTVATVDEVDSDDGIIPSSQTPSASTRKIIGLVGSGKKSLRKLSKDKSDHSDENDQDKDLKDEAGKSDLTPSKNKSPLDNSKELSAKKRRLSSKSGQTGQVSSKDQLEISASDEEMSESLISSAKKKVDTPPASTCTSPFEKSLALSAQKKRNRIKEDEETEITQKIKSPQSGQLRGANKTTPDKSIEVRNKETTMEKKSPCKILSPKVREDDDSEDDDDFVPSSQSKKMKRRKSLALKSPTAKKSVVLSSDSELEGESKVDNVPDIGKHLNGMDEKKKADKDSSTAKSPCLSKSGQKSITVDKRKSLRGSGNQDSGLQSGEDKPDESGPTQRKQRRSVAKVTLVEPEKASKITRVKDSDRSETDQSDVESRPRRKSMGARMSSIKEAPVKQAAPTSQVKTPQAKTNMRKLSASTTKKTFTKEPAAATKRKRRLSLSQADSDNGSIVNSTDSEITFPKLKKDQEQTPDVANTTAGRPRRQSKAKGSPLKKGEIDEAAPRRSMRKK